MIEKIIFDEIVAKAQSFVRNQNARGAFDEPGLRDVTVNNLVSFLIQDLEAYYRLERR